MHLWVTEENERARRFYEQRNRRQGRRDQLGPFPPYPVLLGYTLSLEAS